MARNLSLTVGLIGISVSFFLGILFGSIAGYFGGRIDWVINRVIEILRSLPELAAVAGALGRGAHRTGAR